MYDRLQSKYEDVRHEMNTMRAKYPKSRLIFIAGDGLSKDKNDTKGFALQDFLNARLTLDSSLVNITPGA